jgi:hypothetical protein
VFFLINFSLEINTALLLKKTLDEKMKNISSEEVRKKKEKEKKEANERMRRMIVFSVLSNLLLRLPVAINSMFEIAITFIYDYRSSYYYSAKGENYNVKNNFVFFCLGLNGCEMFDNISNFLYFVSVSFTLIFYNNYDLNFKLCFIRSILRKKTLITNQKSNQATPN